MGKIVVINHLTLDGVMQGPGYADEDTRDGFTHGGWATPRSDESMGAKMGEAMGEGFSFLFGWRTYEDLLQSWNDKGGPFKDALNNTHKYVVTNGAETKHTWPNTTLLHGNIAGAVEDIKRESASNLVVMGSGVLIETLMAADLIDTYLLLIHPLVLGSGRRMFTRDTHASLRLVGCITTATGVVVATYVPAR